MKIALFAFLATAMALLLSGSKADSVSDKDRLATTIADEQALVFDSFDNETALRLGMAMVKYAQDEGPADGFRHPPKRPNLVSRFAVRLLDRQRTLGRGKDRDDAAIPR